MKSRRLMWFVATIFLGVMAIPVQLAAQTPTRHPHYKLIDLGTLGGPHSRGSVNGDGFQLLNNSGVVASHAHTSGSSLAAGASCAISVTFKPVQIGIRNGALSIADTWPSAQESGHRGELQEGE